MKIPTSTYRLQLNASFNFKQVAELLPYLHDLGITTIYASPFFAAPPGSTHGYDVCDSDTLNTEIGTLEQLQHITMDMRTNNMTWLQDVVPNHMVFTMANKRLADVLERGVYSPYYTWFDIDWQHPDPDLHGKLMAPFLGKPLNECLQNQEIVIDIGEGGFVIKYMDQRFPLSISAYELLSILPDATAFTGVGELLQQLYAEAILGLPLASWRQIKSSLVESLLANEQHATTVKQLLAVINADIKLLQAILQQQYYQLSWCQHANRTINYRRFFAVNELIATNMTDDKVFCDYHKLLKILYDQKFIHGLRIDHIDGLQEPGVYINKMRRLFGDDCYMVIEKILEQHEALPRNWPVQGTTGYEFGSQISWLLTDQQGASALVKYYQALFPLMDDYKKITFEKKRQFLQTYMGGEWDNLVSCLYALQLVPDTMDRDAVKQALGLFMCCMSVYRLYPEDGRQPDVTSQQ
ncbi:MAG TPA: alpha-amylase family glycosyl hydrolase, partial [Niastella sp.]